MQKSNNKNQVLCITLIQLKLFLLVKKNRFEKKIDDYRIEISLHLFNKNRFNNNITSLSGTFTFIMNNTIDLDSSNEGENVSPNIELIIPKREKGTGPTEK